MRDMKIWERKTEFTNNTCSFVENTNRYIDPTTVDTSNILTYQFSRISKKHNSYVPTASELFNVQHFRHTIQESPAIADSDKPARRESLPKLLQFDMPTTLSLTILAYLHAFNCCCVRNPRNPEKFTENSNLWSSRSSKVIDLGANRKLICDLLLVINSNFSRICYRFRDIHG